MFSSGKKTYPWNSNMNSIFSNVDTSEYKNKYIDQNSNIIGNKLSTVPPFEENKKDDDKEMKKAFKFLFNIFKFKYSKFLKFLNSFFFQQNSKTYQQIKTH